MMTVVEKISVDLKLDKNYISKIINRADFYYKDYIIPKRNNGKRLISQASPELKTLQYWTVKNVLSKLPVSMGTYAYKKGDSIKRHAEQHKESKFLFHTDIKNFFPNISYALLSDIIKANQLCINQLNIEFDDAIEAIGKICFKKSKLCIGTVSSPCISNIVLYEFDEKMIEYCNENDMKYSRYADDIYVSSMKYISLDIIASISKLLQKYNLSLNYTKTWFCSKKYRQKVTGLVITSEGKVSIGLSRRNDIKKMIYNKLIYNEGNSNQILGYLSFLKDIEPETYNSIIIKYSNYCQGDIIDAIKTNIS